MRGTKRSFINTDLKFLLWDREVERCSGLWEMPAVPRGSQDQCEQGAPVSLALGQGEEPVGSGAVSPPADLAHNCFEAEASHIAQPEQQQLKRLSTAREVPWAPDQLIHHLCAHSLATLLTSPANTTAVGKATDRLGCAFLHHSVFFQLTEHQLAPSLARCPSSLHPWVCPSCRGEPRTGRAGLPGS